MSGRANVKVQYCQHWEQWLDSNLFVTLPFETELRAERQREGIQKAHERGIHFGRKKKLTPAQISELRRRRAQGTLIKTLMHDYGLSKVSVYRYLGTTDWSLVAPHG